MLTLRDLFKPGNPGLAADLATIVFPIPYAIFFKIN